MWGGKDSLRAAVWEVLKHEPEGLLPDEIAQRVASGDFKLAGTSDTSKVPSADWCCNTTTRLTEGLLPDEIPQTLLPISRSEQERSIKNEDANCQGLLPLLIGQRPCTCTTACNSPPC